MKTKIFHIVLLTVMLFGLLAPAAQVQAKTIIPTASSSSKGVLLEGMLNPDGTLNLSKGFSGSLDLSGYNVQIDSKRGPVFGPASSRDNAPAFAATTGDWDKIGDGGGVLTDRVKGIAVFGTNVYIVGGFTDAGNIPEADYVAKWDGTNWSALGSNGAGNGAFDFYTYAVAVDGSGNVYVGGSFNHVYNGAVPNNTAAKIAKWNGSTWSGLGSDGAGGGSLNNDVSAIAVDGSGNVYAGGAFTNVKNGATTLLEADYVAKWNGTSWSAMGNNGAGIGALDGGVNAIAASGTNIYVGGYFKNAAGLSAADFVAKWNGSNWSALGSNGATLSDGSITSGYVSALAISGTDVYVGGNFVDVNNNGAVLSAADFVAKWNGTNWSALGSNGANGALTYSVSSILVNGTDVYVGGNFTNVAGLGEADYLARWDGANWNALGNNGAGDGAIPNKSNPTIMALAMQGSNLLVGGWFYDVNDGSVPQLQADFLAQWNGSNWSAVGSAANGALVNGYSSSRVEAIAVSGTDVYVGGNFSNISNHGVNLPLGDTIVKWDGANWSALGSNGAGDGAISGTVYALAVSGTDLYVGGGFINAGGIPEADYVAKWDGTNWSALGNNGVGVGALPSMGFVYDMAVNGTDLYVGGQFTNAAGIAEADYVAKWDGTNWSALGNNGAGVGALNQSVSALAIDGTGNLYVGGGFTDAAGIAEADKVAKWDGTAWFALGSNGAGDGALNDAVGALAVSGTDLYVGGTFINAANLAAADYIAKWDGTNWSALGGAGGNGSLNQSVLSIVVQGTDVFAGGWFQNVNNNGTILHAADYVARWDGTNWSALGSNGAGNGSIKGNVYAINLLGSDLLVGGEFSNVSNNGVIVPEADYLAAFGTTAAPVDLTPPTVAFVTMVDPSPTSAASVQYIVTFSESVTGVDADDFDFTLTDGVSGAAVSGISGSGATRTVTVNTGTGNGTLRLNVNDTNSIWDLAGNPLGGPIAHDGDFYTGDVYNITKDVTWTVTNLNDPGNDGICDANCSLREAIANALDGHTIIFASGLSGTITLLSPLSTITNNITITGPGASTISVSGGDAFPVFNIQGSATVQISNLTITHGYVVDFVGGGIFNAGNLTLDHVVVSYCQSLYTTTLGIGAGIYNQGSLTITNSAISYNTASKLGGGIYSDINTASLSLTNTTLDHNMAYDSGGGLYTENPGGLTPGTYTLDRVSVTDNTASGVGGAGLFLTTSANITNSLIANNNANGTPWTKGGGIEILESNTGGSAPITVTLTNVTITGNTVYGQGGGMDVDLEQSLDSVTLNNLTISGNQRNSFAGPSSSLGGGGIFTAGVKNIDIENSIIAGNTTTVGGPDCEGAINSLDYNLIQDTTSCTINGMTTHNVTGVSANLDVLADNSGATKTMALLTGSPALNAADNDTCAETDQRGTSRPQGTYCDMGAYEKIVSYTLNAQSTGSQDGWILESGEKTNKGGTMNSAAITINLGDNAAKKQYLGILSFSTKPVLDNAIITKITLKVKKSGIAGGGNPVTTFQGFMVDIKKGIFGTAALQTSDFKTAASKSYGPFKPALKSGWYSMDITPANAYINKLSTSSGLTQIRLRFKLDDNNNAVANYLSLFSGNAPAASRPQLVIEYYVP